MNERIIDLKPDWTAVVLLFMLIFALIGSRNGWQRALVTLVSISFAWLVALKTTDFLIRAINFVTEVTITAPQRGFFQLLLYVASVIMVVVTFNSRVIPVGHIDRRDKLSGVASGVLSGYFFVLLLLDLGREWIATHVEDWQLFYTSSIGLGERLTRTVITITFTNNPYVAYDQLLRAQNLVLLFLLLVFWHGLIFAVLGRLDKKLRATT